MPYSGNLYSKSVENHVFIIHDKKLNDRGVASFSRRGFLEFIKKPFAKQLDGVNPEAEDPVRYVNGPTSGTYKKYEEGIGYQETTVDLDTLLNWIIRYENSQTQDGVDKQHADNEQYDMSQLQDIIESLDSEVVFGKVTFHIYDIGTRRNDRTLASRGAPMITDTPRRKTGGRYHYEATKSLQKSASLPKLGTYIDVMSVDMTDPGSTVTAPLKICYNEALGAFDSSNQLLARLLTDLDPAAITAVNLSVSDLEGRFASDATFYNPASDKYMGQFSTALAVPLSVKDGNPNAFGPNLIKDVAGNELRLEAIRVVNRSDLAYDQGQVVLCTMIDGEWIATTFAGKMEVPPERASYGGWGFSMFAADSQQYFINQTDDSSITPASVLAKLRARFFHTAKSITGVSSSLCNKNGAASSSLRLSPYAQYTSFDLSNEDGGHSSHKTPRCNVEVNKDGDSDGGYPNTSLGLWWGPSFPDGFADGSMQVPADIGTNGDYPSPGNIDQFPLEDGINIVNACNSSGNMAQLVNNIIVGRMNKAASGGAYWFDPERGDDGSFIALGQYPTAGGSSPTTTTTAGSSTTSTTTTTTTTSSTTTTPQPSTTSTTPPEGPPTPSTSKSPNITSTPEPETSTPEPDDTTTPPPIVDFPSTFGPIGTSTTTPAPIIPQFSTTTPAPFTNTTYPPIQPSRSTIVPTTLDPDVVSTNNTDSSKNMDPDDPETTQGGGLTVPPNTPSP